MIKKLIVLLMVVAFIAPSVFANTFLMYKMKGKVQTVGGDEPVKEKYKGILVVEVDADGVVVDSALIEFGKDEDGDKYQDTIDDIVPIAGAAVIVDVTEKKSMFVGTDGDDDEFEISTGLLKRTKVDPDEGEDVDEHGKMDVPKTLSGEGVEVDGAELETSTGKARLWKKATKFVNSDEAEEEIEDVGDEGYDLGDIVNYVEEELAEDGYE